MKTPKVGNKIHTVGFHRDLKDRTGEIVETTPSPGRWQVRLEPARGLPATTIALFWSSTRGPDGFELVDEDGSRLEAEPAVDGHVRVGDEVLVRARVDRDAVISGHRQFRLLIDGEGVKGSGRNTWAAWIRPDQVYLRLPRPAVPAVPEPEWQPGDVIGFRFGRSGGRNSVEYTYLRERFAWSGGYLTPDKVSKAWAEGRVRHILRDGRPVTQ